MIPFPAPTDQIRRLTIDMIDGRARLLGRRPGRRRRVFVLTDGVADPDPEVDRVLVDKVFPSRAHLIDTAGLRGLLQAA